MIFQFPKGFYWGSATSAHQVEGDNVNDWSEWEKENAERLAKEAENKFGHLPNWSDIKEQAQSPQNYISGRACDHYNRYEEDFDIAKSLGHNAHRFSIEWSRIEPEEGKFNEKEIEHYRKVIKALKKRDIEPFVTLWHWTLPIWLADKGGVRNKKFILYFGRYVSKIVGEFNSDVKVRTGFQPISQIPVIDFSSSIGGMTALFEGTKVALKNALDYRNNLENAGINCKTLLFVITDGDNNRPGEASDVKAIITDLLKEERNFASFEAILFGIGTGMEGYFNSAAAEMGIKNVATISDTADDIKKMINFISSSVSSASGSQNAISTANF